MVNWPAGRVDGEDGAPEAGADEARAARELAARAPAARELTPAEPVPSERDFPAEPVHAAAPSSNAVPRAAVQRAPIRGRADRITALAFLKGVP
jgi:hypothetical protein